LKTYYPVVRALSLVILMFGLTMLVPLGVSWFLDDGAFGAFDEAILLTVGTGLGLWYVTRRETRDLTIRDGFLMVALVWTVLPVYAALPLVLQLGLSFTDGYFEAVSGLTTTGATVVTGLDTLPVSINFWRTQLVWLGGMGLIVLAVAILPLLGIGGRQMFKAETPGPMKDTKMTPRIAETAKGLWTVYSLISILCVLAYQWAGMSWLDAIMHMFATMGLGGFSSHDASFAYFDSPTIEAVAIVFMLFAGMNFATHFVVLSGRSLRPYLADPEAGWFLLVTLGSVVGIAVFLVYHDVYPDFPEALRYAAFNVISIATTTGFATTDYALWPFFRAAVDALPVQLCDQRRIDRRRRQDDSRDRPLQAGLPRADARHAPQRGSFGESRQRRRAVEHPLCRSRFRLHVHGLHRRDDLGPFLLRARDHYRVFGGGGQHQQYRARPGAGWPGEQLCRPERLPDLGVHLRHAPRAPRNLHPAGGHDAGFLAEVAGKGDNRDQGAWRAFPCSFPGSFSCPFSCPFPCLSPNLGSSLEAGVFASPVEFDVTRPSNDTFLRALLKQPTAHTPVWLMRQAGRYLPEYRETRARAGSFMQLCTNPGLACEVTLQPLARFDLDAAILFSDILTIPDAMGLGLYFTDGEGPRFERPLREEWAIRDLSAPDPWDHLRYVMDAVAEIRRALNNSVPLIGFSGSPYTLACYMVEGASSTDYRRVKGMLYDRPDLLHRILRSPPTPWLPTSTRRLNPVPRR
jgi:hypothetical protein